MTAWRMRIAWWIPKAINTHLGYVIIIVFPRNNGYKKGPECYVTRILPVLSIYNPESRKETAFCLTQSNKVTTKSRGGNRLHLKIRSTILSHAPWFPKQHYCLEGSRTSSLVLLVKATHKWRWVWYWQGKNKYRGEFCPNAVLSATNLTWTNLWSKPGLCSDGPAINNLNNDTAFSLNSVAPWY